MNKRVEVLLSEADIAMVKAAAPALYEKRKKCQMTTNQLTVEEWLAIRKEAGKKINPATAEVEWCYVDILDPYGVLNHGPEVETNHGRDYFARSPGSDIWVWFGDLPVEVREALWKMHQSKLAFPAGLPWARQ